MKCWTNRSRGPRDRETRYPGAAAGRADLDRLERAMATGHMAAATRIVPAAQRSGLLPAAAPESPRWRQPLFVGPPLLAVLMAGGFYLYKSMTTPVLTGRDSVVLSSVVNHTGDAMFDDALGEALALQLRQSPHLNVVPDQQVAATLRLMGRELMTPITAAVGREVCRRAGAKALLGGTIAMLGTSYVLTLSAQDCVEGAVFAEVQAQAASKAEVLTAMGRAVTAFRGRLGESPGSIQRYDTRIEDATTSSLEALEAYSIGLRTRRTSGDFDSVPSFRRAIELDPEFALAYARLGIVYANLGQADEGRKMTAKAYEFRAGLSDVERYYIEARYHTSVQPDVPRALDVYRVWLAAYPNDYTALANSALLFTQQGDHDSARKNQEAATRVAPDQPHAWSNLATTYMDLGRLDDARKTLQTSLALQDAAGARVNLFVVGVLTNDQALADAQIDALRGRREEVDLMNARMSAAAYRGRMREAATLVTDWQQKMDAVSRRPQTGQGIMTLAINEALVGLHDAARARVAAALDDELLPPSVVDERLVVAAITRDAERARELLPLAIEQFRKDHGSNLQAAAGERAIRALAMLAEGRPADAIPLLEPIAIEPRFSDAISIWTISHVLAQNWETAVKGLTYMTRERSQRGFGATTPYAMALLARSFAQLGRNAEARTAYQAFFDLWKDADPDVPLLVQAREEFARLR